MILNRNNKVPRICEGSLQDDLVEAFLSVGPEFDMAWCHPRKSVNWVDMVVVEVPYI